MDDAINAANIGIDLLRSIAANTGIETVKHVQQMKTLVNKNIYGKLPLHGTQKLAGFEFSVDNAIHGAATAITNMTMGLAPRLATKNFLSANIKMYANALANSWAGNGFFTHKEINEAWTEFHGNSHKISNINKKYKIVNMTERDIMNHALHNKTKRHMKESDSIMGLHFMGDHVVKLVAMVAQMKKDGTYDAHDVNGNYNPRKDERWYTHIREIDGQIVNVVDFSEMSKEGQILMDFTKDRLLVEGLYGQEIDPEGELKGAYFGKELNRIDVLLGRLVADVTNPQHKNMMSAYGISKIFFALKSYMYSLPGEWAQKPHYEESLGKMVVKKVDGVDTPIWERELVEGILYTVCKGLKGIKDHRGNASKVWGDMTPYQKRNLGKLLSFTVGSIGLYLFVQAALQALFGDDEDESLPSPASFVQRTVLGAVDEQWIQINPAQVYMDWKRSPNMFMLQAENFANAGTALLFFPFAAYDEGFATALDEWLYDASKAAPVGGSGYRDVRMFFGDWIETMIAHLENK